MAEMNGLWANFLNCAGLVVVGIGLLLLTIAAFSTCLGLVLCAAQPKRSPLVKPSQQHDESRTDLLRLVTGF